MPRVRAAFGVALDNVRVSRRPELLGVDKVGYLGTLNPTNTRAATRAEVLHARRYTLPGEGARMTLDRSPLRTSYDRLFLHLVAEDHELLRMARAVDWKALSDRLAPFYADIG